MYNYIDVNKKINLSNFEKNIVLIIPYFGKFHNYFDLTLKSMANNPTIHFLLFTNDKSKYDYPNNVHVIYTTFCEFANYIQIKLGFKINLTNPYKLCDFKPTYGFLFQNLIKEFDFWGYCDIDLIFGNIRKFLTNDLLNQFTKFFRRGHFNLFKNDEFHNSIYSLSGSKIGDYRVILSDSSNHTFDERPVYDICREHNIPVYEEEIIADIDFRFKGLVPIYDGYKTHSVFIWKNSDNDEAGVFRYYKQGKNLQIKEFLYIHLQKRNMKIKFDDKPKLIAISNYSFFKIQEEYISKLLKRITSLLPNPLFIKFVFSRIFKK